MISFLQALYISSWLENIQYAPSMEYSYKMSYTRGVPLSHSGSPLYMSTNVSVSSSSNGYISAIGAADVFLTQWWSVVLSCWSFRKPSISSIQLLQSVTSVSSGLVVGFGLLPGELTPLSYAPGLVVSSILQAFKTKKQNTTLTFE